MSKVSKTNTHNALSFLSKQSQTYITPTSKDRHLICDYLKSNHNISISRGSFDLIPAGNLEKLRNGEKIKLKDFILAGLKTGTDMSCIGVHIPQYQQEAATALGKNYKIIMYVNDKDNVAVFDDMPEFMSCFKNYQTCISGFMDSRKVLSKMVKKS